MRCCSDIYTSTPVLLIHNFFFFNDTATTEIYTLSLHDALPTSSMFTESLLSTSGPDWLLKTEPQRNAPVVVEPPSMSTLDQKSTRLNSSHVRSSYSVFCLKIKTFLKSTYMTWHMWQVSAPQFSS